MQRKVYASTGPHLLLLIGVCLALVGIPAATPAQAAVERDQDIDNTLAQFDDGFLQMTASANYPTVDPPLPSLDDTGAVQLSPIAAIRGMNPSTNLPAQVVDGGVVALGRNIFVIGGTTGGSSVSTVYVSQVDLATGALGAWTTDDALPSVRHSPTIATQVAARTQPAVAAYATGQDSGFVYVIGGTVNLPQALSSYSVLRGTVSGGQITQWTSLPDLPFLEEVDGADGLTNAGAFLAQLPNGRVFLYVIGGQQVFLQGGSTITPIPSRQIVVAEIDPATGAFINGGTGSEATWKSTQYQIPLQGFQTGDGLWDVPVVGGNLANSDGGTFTSFYMLGGITRLPSVLTTQIYRADVADDGTLTLSNPSGAGSSNATTGSARSGHAAIQFKGSVYVAGGQVGGSPSASVLSSYIQSDRRFPELGGTGSTVYFLPNNTGLTEPRSGHGMVTVPFPASNPTGAYVYLVGGTGGTDPTRVLRTTISNSATSNVSYPLEGYYISQPVKFVLSNARLRGIFWETEQPAGSNVIIKYRLSNDTDCSQLAKRTDAQAPWQATTGGSTNGNNIFNTTQPANCFQYQARLTPNNNSSSNNTPYLLRLGIKIDVPGATDMTVTQFVFTRGIGNVVTGLQIVIHNENVFLVGEPTLGADFGPGGPGTATGSFFVDVFIYPAGITPPASQPIPTGPTDYSELSIDIFRSEIQAGPGGTGFDFTIPANRPLCDYNTAFNSQTCVTRTLKSLFPAAGTYQVVVVVDGNNDVVENPIDPNKAESNNVFGPISVTVTEDDFPTCASCTIALPLTVRP